MRTKLAAAILVVGLVAAGVTMGMAQNVPQMPQVTSALAPMTCTLPDGVRRAPGGLHEYKGHLYRCVQVFGPELEPDGVRWVNADDVYRRMLQSVPRAPSGR
jgi:hypothetical protein